MKLEEKVGELLKAKKLSLSTAESCTGGGIAMKTLKHSRQRDAILNCLMARHEHER